MHSEVLRYKPRTTKCKVCGPLPNYMEACKRYLFDRLGVFPTQMEFNALTTQVSLTILLIGNGRRCNSIANLLVELMKFLANFLC